MIKHCILLGGKLMCLFNAGRSVAMFELKLKSVGKTDPKIDLAFRKTCRISEKLGSSVAV